MNKLNIVLLVLIVVLLIATGTSGIYTFTSMKKSTNFGLKCYNASLAIREANYLLSFEEDGTAILEEDPNLNNPTIYEE